MSKKSLFYIGAGVLMILATVLSLISSALVVDGWYFNMMLDHIGGEDILSMFKTIVKRYISMMDGWAWMEFFVMILTGVILIAKGIVPDMLRWEMGIAGLFGLLAVFALIGFAQNFFNLFRDGNIKVFVRWLNILSSLLLLVAFGGMTAIIFMKDSFGSFFFVPAAALAFKEFMWFVIRVFGMFGIPHIGFGACLIILIVDMMLVAALFAAGMANNEK